jgi:DNA polymerase-3 subunit epsilon
MIETIYTDKIRFSIDQLNNIPNSFGVYLFWKKDSEIPHYIGKSIKLRNRVKSHFQQANSIEKEKLITHSIDIIECIETTGEFSALLLESRLIKLMSPIMNRRLRKKKLIFTWLMNQASTTQLILHSCDESTFNPNSNFFGLYRSKRQALNHLNEIATRYELCKKLTGLESTNRACFSYQINKCYGACINKESKEAHFARLLNATKAAQHKLWPYDNHLVIKENNIEHIIDHWQYKGTSEIKAKSSEFYADDYKIIYRFIHHAS